MIRSHAYELVDDRLGGKLAERLQHWRACQVSVPAMSRLLEADTKVVVSHQTVRRWLRLLNGDAS